MKAMSPKDIVKATSLKTEIDKFDFSLKISDEFDEFFIILDSSFGFDSKLLDTLQGGLEGKLIPMDYDFLKAIESIKKSRSLFDASIFCASHFKLAEFQDSMLQIFSFKPEEIVRIHKIFTDLIKLKSDFSINKSREEITKKHENCPTKIFEPVNLIPEDGGKSISAVKVTNTDDNKYEYLFAENEVNKNTHKATVRFVKSWDMSHKGIYGKVIRSMRKNGNIDVIKEGEKRKVVCL